MARDRRWRRMRDISKDPLCKLPSHDSAKTFDCENAGLAVIVARETC